MIVKFNVNSSANINSTRTATFDLSTENGVNQFGYTEEEWMAFREDDKELICQEWANNFIEVYYEEEE